MRPSSTKTGVLGTIGDAYPGTSYKVATGPGFGPANWAWETQVNSVLQ